MTRPKPIDLEFCRADLDCPTAVIPEGHIIRVIGGAELPLAVVVPGNMLAGRKKMAAYAHTFAAAPRMLKAIKQALAVLDAPTPLEIQPGSAIHMGLLEAANAAQDHPIPTRRK